MAENHPGWNIIWARRVTEERIPDVEDELQKCKSLGVKLFACLLDPKVEGEYGGTGQTLSWKFVAQHYDHEKNPPLILAGGLTPDNVSDAVRTVRPFGVDVSSGVEQQKGVKDAEMIRAFVRNARLNAGSG
jgi:phosphoribosylanthranilate isomerase